MFIDGINSDLVPFIQKKYPTVKIGNITYLAGWPRMTMAEQVPGLIERTKQMSKYRLLERWFGLGWYGAPPAERFDMVADEPEPVDQHWDAFIAGYTEWLCRTSNITPPEWITQPKRYLDHFWSPETFAIGEHMTQHLIDGSAPWFIDRGVITSDRALLDSKYFIHYDYASLGHEDFKRTELVSPPKSEMRWPGNGISKSCAIKVLAVLANKMEQQRANGWVNLVKSEESTHASTIISESHPRRDEGRGLRTLETDIAKSYGWECQWIDIAATELHNGYPCPIERYHTLWYHPGLAVGCAPDERLIPKSTDLCI